MRLRARKHLTVLAAVGALALLGPGVALAANLADTPATTVDAPATGLLAAGAGAPRLGTIPAAGVGGTERASASAEDETSPSDSSADSSADSPDSGPDSSAGAGADEPTGAEPAGGTGPAGTTAAEPAGAEPAGAEPAAAEPASTASAAEPAAPGAEPAEPAAPTSASASAGAAGAQAGDTSAQAGGMPPMPPFEPDTAAERNGWGTPLPQSDEFDYVGKPNAEKWENIDGCWAGHDGNGQRCGANSNVDGEKLIQTGNENGDTGWLASTLDQQYGRWEARVRSFTTGDNGNDYHPLLIIWPESDSWPQDGEYDFLENQAPGEACANAFIHYPHPNMPVQQEFLEEKDCGAPLSEWHNIAFEWTPDHVRGYIDGKEWYTLEDGAGPGGRKNIQDMPSGHLTIQFDNFYGGGMREANYEIDWVRMYTLDPIDPQPGANAGAGAGAGAVAGPAGAAAGAGGGAAAGSGGATPPALPSTADPAASTPAGTGPASDAPAGSTPASGTPAGAAPDAGAPTGTAPATGAPAETAPAADTPVATEPTGDAPSGDAPSESGPAGANPAGANPAGANPTGANPIGANPIGARPAEGTVG